MRPTWSTGLLTRHSAGDSLKKLGVGDESGSSISEYLGARPTCCWKAPPSLTRAKSAIFIGFPFATKGFLLYDPAAQKVMLSRNVVFDEKSLLSRMKPAQSKVESPKTTKKAEPSANGGTTDPP